MNVSDVSSSSASLGTAEKQDISRAQKSVLVVDSLKEFLEKRSTNNQDTQAQIMSQLQQQNDTMATIAPAVVNLAEHQLQTSQVLAHIMTMLKEKDK